jgi:hypothetical protein
MSEPSARIEGPEKDMAVDSVSVPVSLLEKIVEAARALEDFEGELEDYLLSQDDAFVARLRQARAHHLEGEVRPLDALKRELCIE